MIKCYAHQAAEDLLETKGLFQAKSCLFLIVLFIVHY